MFLSNYSDLVASSLVSLSKSSLLAKTSPIKESSDSFKSLDLASFDFLGSVFFLALGFLVASLVAVLSSFSRFFSSLATRLSSLTRLFSAALSFRSYYLIFLAFSSSYLEWSLARYSPSDFCFSRKSCSALAQWSKASLACCSSSSSAKVLRVFS